MEYLFSMHLNFSLMSIYWKMTFKVNDNRKRGVVNVNLRNFHPRNFHSIPGISRIFGWIVCIWKFPYHLLPFQNFRNEKRPWSGLKLKLLSNRWRHNGVTSISPCFWLDNKQWKFNVDFAWNLVPWVHFFPEIAKSVSREIWLCHICAINHPQKLVNMGKKNQRRPEVIQLHMPCFAQTDH